MPRRFADVDPRRSPGPIAITQPTHAWVSGQLARAWGNQHFAPVEPWEDVCLGAEQHDLGWADWEQHPTLNLATGLPDRFFELPTAQHVAIWRHASRRMLTQSRYASLLVSLHVSGLYERHNYVNDSPAEARDARGFLAEERSFQSQLIRSLSSDSRLGPFATPKLLHRNRRLIAVWDALSLAICTAKNLETTIADVPTADAGQNITLSPITSAADRWTLTPWPFSGSAVSLVLEGRRIPTASIDQKAWERDYAQATWVSVTVSLENADA